MKCLSLPLIDNRNMQIKKKKKTGKSNFCVMNKNIELIFPAIIRFP